MTTTTPQPATVPPSLDNQTPGIHRRWWRRPWVVPLALLAAVFIAYSLPPYLSLDPARSRVPSTFALHYPFLVAHVLFASVAMVTCVMQVWPWFRRRHPAAHRVIGRVYVLGGVIPAGVLGLILSVATPFGPITAASGVVLGPLWLAITVTGWRMAQQGRFEEHRRWMIRSFAITFSFITNRVWGVIFYIALSPRLETTFGGNETVLMYAVGGLASWLGWVIPLLISQWYLEREDAARHRARIARATTSPRHAVQVSSA